MEVGADPLGNITRINNALEAMPAQLEEAQTKLSNVEHQLEIAKTEVNKPFAQEAELSEKLDRLTALNALLNMDEKGNDAIGMDEEGQEAEPERKLADRPAERTSLKGKLSEMKARVSGHLQEGMQWIRQEEMKRYDRKMFMENSVDSAQALAYNNIKAESLLRK